MVMVVKWNALSLLTAVKGAPSGFTISAVSTNSLRKSSDGCSGKHPELHSFLLAGTEEIPHREESAGKAVAALTCGLVG